MHEDVAAALELLRAAGTDTEGVEAKAAAGGFPGAALLKSISAFANTGTGLILLGVDEESGFEVVDVDASKLASQLAAVCRESVDPPVPAAVEIVEVEGKQIVAAHIFELPADQKPAYVKTKGMNRGSYVRVHDSDRQLTTYEVSILLANRTQPRYDAELVAEATLDDLDGALVDAFVARLRTNKPSTFRDATTDETLLLVGAADRDDGGVLRPTLAGLLALGRYPQRWFPQLNVAVVAYPTPNNEPLADGTRFLDNVAIDGPVPRMVVDAVAAVQRNLSRRSRVPSLFREDEWDFPIEVIRELIVNALMHRDLSPGARGAQVRIEIYPDRLEVHNPGGLFGPVSVQDLGVRPVTSSRNAHLGKLLEDTLLPGTDGPVAENRGSGFVTLTRRLEAIGMGRPVVTDEVATFTVRLNSTSLLDDVALDDLERFDTSGWSDLQRLVVALAAREAHVTNERVREVSGAHASDVGTAFVGLRQLGVLERIGQGRGSSWRLLPAASDQAAAEVADTPRVAADSPSRRRPTRDAPQALALLRDLAQGPASAAELHQRTALGTKRNVLYWLRRLEDEGLVGPTEAKRKSPANRWELTKVGAALLADANSRHPRS
jgi:ATP-dependent DNA helicase RecG